MATERRPPSGPDIPDLDGGTPRPKQPAPSPVEAPGAPLPRVPAPSTSARGPLDYFGSGTFDDDQFETSNVTIALDTGAEDSWGQDAPSRSKGSTDHDDLDLYEGSSKNARIVHTGHSTAESRRKWPTGTTPDGNSLRVDAVEVRVAAGYGAVPGSAFGAPGYALRVRFRKRALAAQVKELSVGLADSEEKRDDLLVAMVQDLRARILATEKGEALFESIIALEQLGLERRSALSGTSAEYDARVAELVGHHRANDRKMEAQRSIIEQRTAAHTELVRSFARTNAKRKRLYMELEGLVSISEKAAGKLSAEQSVSMARLEGEIQAQKPEADATLRAMESSKTLLATANADLHEIELSARELERLRRVVDQELQKQIGTRNQGVTEAEQQRFEALVALARTVLSEKGRLVEVRTEILDEVARADEIVAGRAADLEKHVRAVDDYDPDVAKKGFGMLALAAVLVLVVLIALATR